MADLGLEIRVGEVVDQAFEFVDCVGGFLGMLDTLDPSKRENTNIPKIVVNHPVHIKIIQLGLVRLEAGETHDDAKVEAPAAYPGIYSQRIDRKERSSSNRWVGREN